MNLWPGVTIRRESIFEAVVEFAGEHRDEGEKGESAEMTEVEGGHGAGGKKVTKKAGRRVAAKKQAPVVKETVRGDLWG